VTAPAAEEPTEDTPHAHALAYAALGWRVLPIKPGGKHPPMASWQHFASHETSKIDSWYKGLYRDCGVGIAMGAQPNGTILIAVDVDEHDPAQSGSETLWELQQIHGELPETVTAITGSGGKHLIFKLPAGVEPLPNVKLGSGIDTRGQGGQIVVAPTVHPDTGRPYQWEHGYAPWEREVAVLPPWVGLLLAPAPQIEPAAPKAPLAPDSLVGQLSETPAEWLRQRWDWQKELTAAGWHHDGNTPDGTSWRRPGKSGRNEGASAVLHGNDGPLVVWSTDAEVAAHWTAGTPTRDGSGVALSPLAFYAATHHWGDVSGASRALRTEMTPPHTLAADVLTGDTQPPTEPPDDPFRIINWSDFWRAEHVMEEWLAEPIIAAKRGHAVVAKGGDGKSLLTLWLCVGLATGGPLLTDGRAPIDVMYVDYEMTGEDLEDRLSDMGYGPDSDLSHLHYAQLPAIGPLDLPPNKGGAGVDLANRAAALGCKLVVIDTYGRAVDGDENEADTTRRFYVNTAIHLKREGIAFIRVDHLGKDADKGARGSSAKNDDVDVVWQLKPREQGIVLKATKRRVSWVPETVDLTQETDPLLRYTRAAGDETWPAGTKAAADELDRLGLPLDVTMRDAQVAYRAAGLQARNQVVRAAVKWRRASVENVWKKPTARARHAISERAPTPDPTHDGTNHEIPAQGGGHTSGHAGAQTPDVDGAQCPRLKTGHAATRDPEQLAIDDQNDPNDPPEEPQW